MADIGDGWPPSPAERPAGRSAGEGSYGFRQGGRLLVFGLWDDVPVHGDDQVGDGVSAGLAAFLRNGVGSRPVKIVPCVCGGCGGRVFSVLVDDDEGAAERACVECGRRAFIADSQEFWEDADPGEAACPCGSEEFEAAVAFSLDEDGLVRWVTVGLECRQDSAVGVYVDWKIDYSPTDHLLGLA